MSTPDIRPVGDLPNEIGKTAARELSLNGITSLELVSAHTKNELLALHGVGHAHGIEAGARPHLARGGVVDDQHPHRSVALGLQDETALELQGRAQQDGEHDRLAQELRDRRGIAVAREDGVDGRAETHEPPAQLQRLDLERQDGVVGRGLRRGARRDGGVGLGHRVDIVWLGGKFDPSSSRDRLASALRRGCLS